MELEGGREQEGNEKNRGYTLGMKECKAVKGKKEGKPKRGPMGMQFKDRGSWDGLLQTVGDLRCSYRLSQ